MFCYEGGLKLTNSGANECTGESVFKKRGDFINCPPSVLPSYEERGRCT